MATSTLLGPYVRQQVERLPCTGTNKNGASAYGPVVREMVRWEDVRRLVRNTAGESVVSEALVYTETRPDPRDKYRMDGYDWPIIRIATMRDIAGRVIGYEVSL